MEIIEKQVEKVKEVPADNYGYNYGRRDINGKANAGLTLGIIGTALGAWALFGGRRSALEGMKMMVSWMCLILEAIGLVTGSETLA